MPIIGLEVQRTETVYSGALHLHRLAEFQATNLSPPCGYPGTCDKKSILKRSGATSTKMSIIERQRGNRMPGRPSADL